MELAHPNHLLFVPDGAEWPQALARTTHLCLAAHPDDVEIMAFHGIAQCFGQSESWFSAAVLTQGARAPRGGPYANRSDAEMAEIRRKEQKKAAYLGEYGAQILLGYSSDDLRQADPRIFRDLRNIFLSCRPHTLYLHSPADRHDTHVASCACALKVLRSLPAELRPKRVLGCEVWGDLDWLEDRVPLSCEALPHLAQALIGVFDSQISGGKRYDLGTLGRRLANSVYHSAYHASEAGALTWAMDLSPLLADPEPDLLTFTLAHVERFRQEIAKRLSSWSL
jgi:LmbE family N-acetylglucosaminyl deacetylase